MKEKYTVKFLALKNKYVCYYFFISKLKSPDDDYDKKYNFIASNDSVQKIETIITLN